MRYRQLDSNGDFVFGSGVQFLVNTPAAVAQAVLTKLKLFAGEWFLDSGVGTPYSTQILGTNTQGTRDMAIKTVILNTPGVTSLALYSSSVDANRKFTVNATINTIYGQVTISENL